MPEGNPWDTPDYTSGEGMDSLAVAQNNVDPWDTLPTVVPESAHPSRETLSLRRRLAIILGSAAIAASGFGVFMGNHSEGVGPETSAVTAVTEVGPGPLAAESMSPISTSEPTSYDEFEEPSTETEKSTETEPSIEEQTKKLLNIFTHIDGSYRSNATPMDQWKKTAQYAEGLTPSEPDPTRLVSALSISQSLRELDTGLAEVGLGRENIGDTISIDTKSIPGGSGRKYDVTLALGGNINPYKNEVIGNVVKAVVAADYALESHGAKFNGQTEMIVAVGNNELVDGSGEAMAGKTISLYQPSQVVDGMFANENVVPPNLIIVNEKSPIAIAGHEILHVIGDEGITLLGNTEDPTHKKINKVFGYGDYEDATNEPGANIEKALYSLAEEGEIAGSVGGAGVGTVEKDSTITITGKNNHQMVIPSNYLDENGMPTEEFKKLAESRGIELGNYEFP